MVGRKAVVFLLCALMMSSVLIHLPAAEAQGNPHEITLVCSSPVEIHVSPDDSGWGWGICTISNPTIHQVDTIVETDWSGETDHPESVTVPAGTAIDFEMRFKALNKEVFSGSSVVTATITNVNGIPWDQHDGERDTVFIEVMPYWSVEAVWGLEQGSKPWVTWGRWYVNGIPVPVSPAACSMGATYTAELHIQLETNSEIEWKVEAEYAFYETIPVDEEYLYAESVMVNGATVNWDYTSPSSEPQQILTANLEFADDAPEGFYMFSLFVSSDDTNVYEHLIGFCELQADEEVGVLASLTSSSNMVYMVGGGATILVVLLLLVMLTRRIGGRDFADYEDDDLDFDDLDF